MNHSRSHLSNSALSHSLSSRFRTDEINAGEMLADLAEFDERKLYLPAGYHSMRAYVVGEFHLFEEAAHKRVRAARTARRHPAVFNAVAEGRLHLSAVVMLASSLTEENAEELIAAATHKTKSELELLLATRSPRPDVPTRIEAIASPVTLQLSPGTVGASVELSPGTVETSSELSPGTVETLSTNNDEPTDCRSAVPVTELSPGTVERVRIKPLSAERFSLQGTMPKEMHDLLRYVQSLLSHQPASGDVMKVLHDGLRVYAKKLEKRKFRATTKPGKARRRSGVNRRYIPAAVMRAVWKRDGGQCAFVGDNGHRCESRERIEFDHMDEVARGGSATVDRIRLRCQAHNQYGAECTFGVEFMKRKREEAQQAAAEARAEKARKAAEARAVKAREKEEKQARIAREHAEAEAAKARALEEAKEKDVTPWLRQLGFRADQARYAARLCEAIPDASLEDRVRFALSRLAPRAVRHAPA